MKHRTPLVLMELVVMLLVFSLAAGLCMQGFAWADTQSLEENQKDRAFLQLQNAAEQLKAGEEVAETLLFDENWQSTQKNPVYVMKLTRLEREVPYLAAAQLEITDRDGKSLGKLTVSWQEVQP